MTIAFCCVHVRSNQDATYKSQVDANEHATMVDIGELYTHKESCLWLLVLMPTVAGAGEDVGVTTLLKVSRGDACEEHVVAQGYSAEGARRWA
jgi:hypothetical protein